jgi:hypothetical protein
MFGILEKELRDESEELRRLLGEKQVDSMRPMKSLMLSFSLVSSPIMCTYIYVIIDGSVRGKEQQILDMETNIESSETVWMQKMKSFESEVSTLRSKCMLHFVGICRLKKLQKTESICI